MDSVVAVWHSYIADLDDREFERQIDVIYRNAPTIVSVWNMIFHVFNHNTLHRTEMRLMVAALHEPLSLHTGFERYCLCRNG